MASESVFLIEAHDLAVKYPTGDLALYDVNFEIESPSFTAIIGPNGSGKSTLLRTALGLLRPAKGSLKVLGYDSRKEKKKIRQVYSVGWLGGEHYRHGIHRDWDYSGGPIL